VQPTPSPDGGIALQSASKKRADQSITFSVAISKIQEVATDGSQVVSYDIPTNLTAVENILLNLFMVFIFLFYKNALTAMQTREMVQQVLTTQ